MPENNGADAPDLVDLEWVRKHLDEEEGSVWDWTDFHDQYLEDDDTVRELPERTWVDKVQAMLAKGGAPNKVYLALTLPLRQANIALSSPELPQDKKPRPSPLQGPASDPREQEPGAEEPDAAGPTGPTGQPSAEPPAPQDPTTADDPAVGDLDQDPSRLDDEDEAALDDEEAESDAKTKQIREITEFVESALLKPTHESGLTTPLSLVLSQMTHAIAVKRMYFEKVFHKRADGRIVYSKIAYRPPEACELLRNKRSGDIEGFKQFVGAFQREDADSEGYVTVPAERTFVYIHGQHRDPYNGISDLEATFWAYELRMKVLALWHMFLDRSALGKLIVYGQNATEANARAKKFAQLRSSGTIGVGRDNPDEHVFDQLPPEANGTEAFNAMVTYLDAEMTGSVLANWADLASSSGNGKGSYALSSDQSSLFLSSRYAVAREMAQAVTEHLIAPLVHINFGPEAPVPQLRIEKIDDAQIQVALQLLQSFGTSNSLNVPEEFIHQLMERISLYLEMDQDKVRNMLEVEADQVDLKRKQRQRAEEMGMVMGMPGGPPGQQPAAGGGPGMMPNSDKAAGGQSRSVADNPKER